MAFILLATLDRLALLELSKSKCAKYIFLMFKDATYIDVKSGKQFVKLGIGSYELFLVLKVVTVAY